MNAMWTQAQNSLIFLGDNWMSLIARLLALIVVLIVTVPVSRWAERVTERFFVARGKKDGLPTAQSQHAATIGTMLGSVARFLVWVLSVGVCLGILGLNTAVTSLLTAAGIGGLAIGFGAQKIIQDVFAGLMLLMDKPCVVGDMVRIGAVTGIVRAIRMRMMVVESADGETHMIPNGTIGVVTNLFGSFGLAAVEINIGVDKEYDEIRRLLAESALTALKDNPHVIGEPVVLGITALTPSIMTFRTECKTKPALQSDVERIIRAEQLAALKKAGFV